jgi:hypothetical protein
MSRHLLILIIIKISLFVVISTAYASESQFTTTLTIGDGSTPTTTPTTTPPITPIVNDGNNTSGSSILQIRDLTSASTQNSSLITFTTNHAAQAKVYWGLTENYELGSVSGIFYNFEHSINLSDLASETRYYYKVEVIDGLGVKVSETSSLQTLRDYSFSPLANVSHFEAIPEENSIMLQWIIPRNRDIESVRIVRSDKFFPRDITDGEIIFEGYAENYLDQNVVVGKMYYYALFARDIEGNYSSGVLAQAQIKRDGQIVIPTDITDPFAGTTILQNVDEIIRNLEFSDFDFIQDGRRIENTESIVTIDGKKDLTVILDYDKVPEILKTIAITLKDSEDDTKVFTFLLRVNKEKTGYVATIGPLGKSGKFKMSIIVLDYKNQGLRRIEGVINALVWEERSQELFRNCGVFDEFVYCEGLEAKNRIIKYIILLILLIIAILGFVFRRTINKKESGEIHEE